MADRKTQWNASLDAVKTFIETHGKYPSTLSQNPAEKSLAQWWSRQRFLLKNNKLDEERKSLVEGVILHNESLDRDGVWNSRYDKLVNKYKLDNALFAYNSTVEEEAQIMRWWNQQKTFARKFAQDNSNPKGGMTTARYEKIAAFMRVMNQELVKDTLASH